MDSKERLKIVVNIINKKMSYTNEDVSKALGYKAKNYVSDIIGGAKPINDLFLERLEKTFLVNPEYIKFDKSPQFFESNMGRRKYQDYDEKHSYVQEDDPKYLTEKLTEAQKLIRAQEQIIQLQNRLLEKDKKKESVLKRAK